VINVTQIKFVPHMHYQLRALKKLHKNDFQLLISLFKLDQFLIQKQDRILRNGLMLFFLSNHLLIIQRFK